MKGLGGIPAVIVALLLVLFTFSTRGFVLKKATKALGGYALVKALEPKPPQMVGIMMPMPLMNMMEPMTPMMDDKFPSAAMMAMMMASMDKKPEMNEPVMEMKTPASMMSMPDMMKMMKGADARPVNGQMMMPSQLPSEPSDQQVLAAVHALEHRRLRAIPRNIHIH